MRYIEGAPRAIRIRQKVIDRITRFNKRDERKRTREGLIASFLSKAIEANQVHGFTVQRRMSHAGSVPYEALISMVVLGDSNKKYLAYLKSSITRNGSDQVDGMQIEVIVEDFVDLSELSTRTKRSGHISKQIVFGLTDGTSRQESVKAVFYQSVKKAGQLAPIPYFDETTMPTNDSITFLRELLVLGVDIETTNQEFEKAQKDEYRAQASSWSMVDIYWNRENPLEIQRFFSSASPYTS